MVHSVCIPSIVWSLFGLVNKLGQKLGLDQKSYYKFTPSISIYLCYMIYYLIISPSDVYFQTFYFYLIILINVNMSNRSTNKFISVQLLGWVLQIASHKYLEGNSPALLSGAMQSFVTAPIFVVDEIVHNFEIINFKYIAFIYIFWKKISFKKR
jgi:uncharacterized membrane protein YGL010W